MKIIQVVHSFPSHSMAGTELYTYSLSKELAKKHCVFVFHRMCDPKLKEYQIEHSRFEDLNVFRINNTFKFCNSFEMFYRNEIIADKFGETLDQLKPEIVHIQHLIYLSTTIINEIKKRGIPIVFTLHDYWLICPQWHFLKKDFSICNDNDISQCINCLNDQLSIKKLPRKIYLFLRNSVPNFLIGFLKKIYLNLARANFDPDEAGKKISARKRHIKVLCSMVDFFIAPSQFLKKRYVEFGIPIDKINFISHGINSELFKNFEKKESNKIRFGFIGTILPAKGVDILIKAFNKLGNNQAELKIYGRLFPYKGFEHYPRYVQSLAKNRNIRFMGEFNNKKIADVLSDIDILVLPSIWHENSPLTILEGFSTNTPIIASNIGGIPELIRDRVDGLLFEPRNCDDLYEKMKIFIDNPSLIEKLKSRINSPKNMKENTQELEKIYMDLLKKKCA